VLRMRRSAMVCSIALVVSSASIVRYFLPDNPPCNEKSLTLLSFNVLTSNQEKERVIGLIRSSRADVIALYEVDSAWVEALREIETEYPYTVYSPREDNFGVALLARKNLVEAKVEMIGPTEVPSIVAESKVEGLNFLLFCTHPIPPMGGSRALIRDQQLAEIADRVASSGRKDVMVAGDLNASPWSAALQPLYRAGLRDARLGHGISPTWSRNKPWISIPIDHVLIGDALHATKAKILDASGSDHNPVMVTFCGKK
jgi:endonuclease/exonuclease/phosphatase (EEP) superfamily protein YafD